jgi:hypothetical protein
MFTLKTYLKKSSFGTISVLSTQKQDSAVTQLAGVKSTGVHWSNNICRDVVGWGEPTPLSHVQPERGA